MLIFHSGHQTDHRTRHDRLQRASEAWNIQYPALVEAFLYWDCHGAPSSELPPDVGGDDIVCILCMDTFSRNTQCFRVADPTEHLNTMLVRHGYIACSPTDPSLAISLETLAIYKAFSTHCSQLSVQSFVCALCDLQGVCLLLLSYGYCLAHGGAVVSISPSLTEPSYWCH